MRITDIDKTNIYK